MIKLIAAIGKNNELGKNNSLLWSLKEDMKYFRTATAGACVIMGRLTFESIGRPLPKRRNIVITRSGDYRPEGVEIAHSLTEALEMCGHDCFVIGGGRIYAEALPYADEILLTEINCEYPDADVYFPELDKSLYTREVIGKVNENGVEYEFVKYTKEP